jgi:hypothetical protein
MIVYTVHEPVPPPSSLDARSEAIVFVKEGFSWLGLLFPLPWLLFNRLWFEFLAALGLTALLGAVGMWFGLGQEAAASLGLFVNVLVGFEGNNLKRWKLERRGYATLASVVGRDFEEVERRFFDAWYPALSGGAVKATSGSTSLASGGNVPWKPAPAIGTLPAAGG